MKIPTIKILDTVTHPAYGKGIVERIFPYSEINPESPDTDTLMAEVEFEEFGKMNITLSTLSVEEKSK